MLELAALRQPSLLAQSVADVFGLPQSLRGAMAPLLDHLRSRRLLLLLDNCEHLLDAVASLTLEVLRSCPDVRIVATSRQLLGVAGEQAVPVPPLETPDLARLPPAGELARWEAPSLLVERAAAVVPGFAVNEENQSAIAQLCHRLDGLPLAIELAAVRLRVLGVEELLTRLGDRFQLLRGGSRAALPRQQTLRALIDWSYDLCEPREQLLWARLSVFSHGFDLAAVEAVCSGDGIERDAVLDLVASLVDKSVLLPYGPDAALGRRYRMLETIREYGRARLADTGQERELLLRHRDHYKLLARQAKAEWFGADELAWAVRLRMEHANLRVALNFCAAEPEQAGAGLELAADLWPFWVCCGLLTEGRHWIDRMLAADTAATQRRAVALWSTGSLAVLQGDLVTGQAQLRECEALANELGDEVARAWARQYLGLAMLFGGGDLERAAALVESAVLYHRAAGNLLGLAKSLYMLAAVLSFYDVERAVAAGTESVRVAEETGERWCLSYALYMLSLAAWRRGDLKTAWSLGLRNVRLRAPFQDSLGLAMGIDILGWVAAAAGKYEHAARLLGSTGPIWESVGALEFGFDDQVASYHGTLARCRERLGDERFEAAFNSGAKLDLDEAVALALSDEELPALPVQAAPALPEAANSGPAEQARVGAAPLSAREAEVAALVAKGLANRRIAEELVLSQRTVEAHVSRIMAKLDFNSRAQIAVWAVRNGLG